MAFEDHNDAARALLGRDCADYQPPTQTGVTQCDPQHDWIDIGHAARAAGYDSIQFLRHCDLGCGRCAHELAIFHGQGSDACPGGVELRTGFNASLPCQCEARPRRGWGCTSCTSFPEIG